MTLGGQVASDDDKSQAESLAKSLAGAQVVANQIAVIPTGAEKGAKAVNSDLDKGIEKNLDAALIQNKMHDNVKYEVKNGVVTLTGEVNSQYKRDRAEKVATSVPNVKQVVNDLQVKLQIKAWTNFDPTNKKLAEIAEAIEQGGGCLTVIEVLNIDCFYRR